MMVVEEFIIRLKELGIKENIVNELTEFVTVGGRKGVLDIIDHLLRGKVEVMAALGTVPCPSKSSNGPEYYRRFYEWLPKASEALSLANSEGEKT